MNDDQLSKRTWIDCLLAIEEADLPNQEIGEEGILLAFLLAIRREAEPTETRSRPQLFIAELRKI